MKFSRYAVFYTPPAGRFAAAGAAWLGWDISAGQKIATADLDLVQRPQKYGFHATLKPPFTLVDGMTQPELEEAVQQVARDLVPKTFDGLRVTLLGRLIALTLIGDTEEIKALAARCVTELDAFRTPLSAEERRRKTRPQMRVELKENLELWGYPHVQDAFRFHMTLSRPLNAKEQPLALNSAKAHFARCLPTPFAIDDLTLVGEERAGMFHEIKRFRLGATKSARPGLT